MSTVIRSSFSNQGQICLCGSRLLIEDSIYDRFKLAFVERVSQLKVGDPLDANSRQGAIVSKLHHDKIVGCIETAREEGGIILCGGKSYNPGGRCEHGFFIEPTVIENLGPHCETNQEEIFWACGDFTAFSKHRGSHTTGQCQQIRVGSIRLDTGYQPGESYRQ